jgi:hypothetical protein
MRWLVEISSLGSDIQTDEGLTGSGYTRDEADSFVPPCTRLIHQFLNTPRGDVKILGTGIVTRDSLN